MSDIRPTNRPLLCIIFTGKKLLRHCGYLWRRTIKQMLWGVNICECKFLHFLILDSKSIVQKIEQFHSICCDLSSDGISLCNSFIVNCLIEKLPASLVNFMIYLQRIWGRLTSLEDILIRIKFEDLNKNHKENQSCSIRDEK